MSGQHESLKEALWQMQILRRGGGEGGEVGDALHSFHVYTLFINWHLYSILFLLQSPLKIQGEAITYWTYSCVEMMLTSLFL